MIRDGVNGVQNLVNAFGGGGALLDGEVDAGELLDRVIHDDHREEKYGEAGQVQAGLAGIEKDGDGGHDREDFHQRIDRGFGGNNFDLAAKEVAVVLLEAGLFVVFVAVGFNNGGALDGFLLDAGEIGDAFLADFGMAADAAADDGNGDDAHGEDRETNQRQAPVGQQ